MKRLTIIFALLATLGLTAWKLSTNKEKVEKKVYQPDVNLKVGVTTSVAALRNLSQENEFLGSFTPNREIEIKPLAGGEVIQLPINEGQGVRAGQLIAKLDDEQIRFQIEALQVTLEGYQNDLKRYEVLVKGDAVPAVNLERTQLSIRGTQAQIKQLKKQLENTTVTAPFAGIVTSKLIEKGSVVSVGAPIATITDIAALKLVVNIPEKSINQFKVGQTIPIETQVYPNVYFNGKVNMVGVSGDASHNYPVEILVQNRSTNPLKAGMYGSIVNDNQLKAQSLSIPRQAIVGSTKKAQVYVVENGKAILKDVTIGVANNEYYEITQGIKAGDQVVVSGQINLQNGTAVVAQ